MHRHTLRAGALAACLALPFPAAGADGEPGVGLLDDDLHAFEPDPAATVDPYVRASGEPNIFYLVWANGDAVPNNEICKGKPPAFTCTAGTAGCADGPLGYQKLVQGYLDKWYADFNIIFTFTKPTGVKYYTEIVSAGGAWCGRSGGIASSICKRDLQDRMAVAYTFNCGGSVRTELCAAIIAQEHGHLAGLDHTNSKKDVMIQGDGGPGNYVGFEDKENTALGSTCRKTQNSYQELKAVLGEWPVGTPKPGPFGAPCEDKLPPQVAITEPADGAVVAADLTVRATASDDCGLKEIRIDAAGGTATARPPGPFEWNLTNLAGQVKIEVTATDAAGKTALTSITVRVAGGAAADGSGDQDGATGGPDGGGGGEAGEGAGCGCRTGGREPLPGLPIALGALSILLARRRWQHLRTQGFNRGDAR